MQASLSPSVCRAFLRCQIEKAVDELNLANKVVSCHPSNLPLPDHMNRFVTLYRSPSRLAFSEALLGVHFRTRRGICFSSGVPVYSHYGKSRLTWGYLPGYLPRVKVLFEEMGINLLQARLWTFSVILHSSHRLCFASCTTLESTRIV